MGLFTFLNTREIKAQNEVLLVQLADLVGKVVQLSGRIANLEAEVAELKTASRKDGNVVNGG